MRRITPCLFSVVLALVCSTVWASSAAAIEVEPREARLVGNFARLQLRVTADAAGRPVDATRQTQYVSAAPQIVEVDARGKVTPLAAGKTVVHVQHSSGAVDVPIEAEGVAPEPVASFREDVLPVFNKAGCSQGACHAAQYGQGGFKLSLLGFAPEEDFPELAREWSQRRISRLVPEDSLFLRKATMSISHGGGRRIEPGSDEYQTLAAWVACGAPAPLKQEAEIVELTVSPTEQIYRVGQGQQLRAVARYSDGSVRDVTHRAKFDSLGDGVAKVDPTGYVTAVGHGQAAVMIRYQGQAIVSHVVSPYHDSVDLAGFQPLNVVDEKVMARWQRLGLTPAGLCSDEQFIRRAYLDAIGTLPRPERIASFVASTDANKRTALVDELLGLTGDPQRDLFVNEWSAYWALKWGDLIRNNRNDVGEGGMWSLYNWLRQSLRENKPVDQFVREIITAEGSIYQNGPANYYKIARTPTDLAETTAQVFLGVRLQCAKCHHHPFEVYSQADYYGLAAFFTRVGSKPSTDFGGLGGDAIIKVNSSGSIRHPRSGAVMQPTPLLGQPIADGQLRDPRRLLAEWLTSRDNRLFAHNIVNRIWGYLMGSGLVEPIDDLRATNPPSNPELLDALSDEFAASGYDLRKLMRLVMTSRVYQLSSTPTPETAADTRFYTHYNVKRLPAEVLMDAIDYATGTLERFPGVPPGTRAIELPDPNYASYFLDTLGRPQRVIACECERTVNPNLAQVLQIANGELINRKLADKKGRLAQLIQNKTEPREAIAQLYLATVCRPPSATEIEQGLGIIQGAPNAREGLEDLLWALCNSREFLFNH
ncbi:MAG TPA: DUF1553 domain-containing protein [Pirellulales bacterium]|nr:DUF1553 domain-containing protein [Pirellulales bacterium]